jgi:hypothetical protein
MLNMQDILQDIPALPPPPLSIRIDMGAVRYRIAFNKASAHKPWSFVLENAAGEIVHQSRGMRTRDSAKALAITMLSWQPR